MHAFKVGDIVTVAIPAKDHSVNDARRMEAKIISVPHGNRYRLQTEYRVLANSYSTSEINLVPPDELGPTELIHLTRATKRFNVAATFRLPAPHYYLSRIY